MATRQAVGICLTRDPSSTETYMVKRNPSLKFFAGFYAYPGGTLDEEDVLIGVVNDSDLSADHLPFIVAAVRELFEETGILLTDSSISLPKEKLREYRRQLLKEQITFSTLLENEELSIDAGQFNFLCTLLTPEFAPVRYDTRFYWVDIANEPSPEIWPGELETGTFVTAESALQKWRSGEAPVVPPLVFMLEHIEKHGLQKAVPIIQNISEQYAAGAIHQIFFTPGVQMLPLKTRTLLPATHTNCYLVGEKELYIIDPAPADPAEQQRLWDYLDERLDEGRIFKGILLTHHHSDHVGALEACRKRYDLPVLAHENTAGKVGMPEIKYLTDGDVLDLGTAPDGSQDWQLKVIHTPGHASGHLAFQENRYGTIIIGDLISTLSTIVISPPDGHLATYMTSLASMAEIAEGALYPGHGPAVMDGKKVLHYFIRHRQQREDKLLDALRQTPQTPQDLVGKVYDDVSPEVLPLAHHSLEAGLIKLIEEGRCQQDSGGYRLC